MDGRTPKSYLLIVNFYNLRANLLAARGLRALKHVVFMPKWYTKEEALQRLQRYCAYQDRCHQEVRDKLRDMKVPGDWQDEVILSLLEDNFLNEERFARSFARGKFRMKKWGRVRIRRELKQRGISDYCIKAAMSEIEEAAYEAQLWALLRKKQEELQEPDSWKEGEKIGRYLLQKGYEPKLVWEAVRSLRQENEDGR